MNAVRIFFQKRTKIFRNTHFFFFAKLKIKGFNPVCFRRCFNIGFHRNKFNVNITFALDKTMNFFVSLFKQFLFWMLFFFMQRALFLVWYSGQPGIENIPFGEILLTFVYAFKLDMATVSYILIVPFLILVLQLFIKSSFLDGANKIYTGLVLFSGLLVSDGELGSYAEWNSKLSFKSLLYFQNPTEVIESIPNKDIFVFIGFFIVQFIVFFYFYRRFFYRASKPQNAVWQKVVFTLVVPGLLFVGIRGGFGEIPITASNSYFSKHNLLNIAAVNPVYNISFSAIEYFSIESGDYFHFMEDGEAVKIVDKLHFIKKDTTVHILNLARPNIVILFLESWSGDLIESLGGVPGITPQFHELEKKGMFFTRFYASGNRSQQALASVFGGLPALPITTLTDHPEKYNSVPSLIKKLNREDYFTSFYFGGDLNYGNIKSYLVHNEFDLLVAEDDFPKDAVKGKLGFHDEVLFDKLLAELGNQQQPFFTAALTLSSHSPYDQPGEKQVDWIDNEEDYVNSTYYTDNCLGEFFAEAEKLPWYKNTLFIILSDHSHVSYNNYQWWSFNYRNIPLLFLGGALSDEFIYSTNSRISSNVDLTSTILKQLNLSSQEFFWSKNLFNPYTPQFASFELNDGFGWMKQEGRLEYNVVVPMVLYTNLNKPKFKEFKKEGEAYYQVLFQEFLGY